jgi:hypothetical protein
VVLILVRILRVLFFSFDVNHGDRLQSTNYNFGLSSTKIYRRRCGWRRGLCGGGDITILVISEQ